MEYYERMELGGTNREEGKNEGELRARRLAKFKMYGNSTCKWMVTLYDASL